MILKMACLLAIHTCRLDAPILLEEAAAAGIKQIENAATAAPACDKMRTIGQWNTA
jgi:hypothetical protein